MVNGTTLIGIRRSTDPDFGLTGAIAADCILAIQTGETRGDQPGFLFAEDPFGKCDTGISDTVQTGRIEMKQGLTMIRQAL
jgi:hypothetical protein